MHPAQASGAVNMKTEQNSEPCKHPVTRKKAGRGSGGGLIRFFCHPPYRRRTGVIVITVKLRIAVSVWGFFLVDRLGEFGYIKGKS
jgi:hypothetical protein